MKQASANLNGKCDPAWKRVWSGIWRHNISKTLYERPKLVINGVQHWTFRSLCTKALKVAKEELYHRKSARSAAREGLGNGVKPSGNVTAGNVLRRYRIDGYRDRQRKMRPESMEKAEEANCNTLLEYWDQYPVSQIKIFTCDKYHDWRCERVERGTGDRTVDLELNTLSNALAWACRIELIHANPLADGRPKYCSAKSVRHCREFMPANADELHAAARVLMLNPASVVLGFQALIQAQSGLRTIEALRLRDDAKPFEPGWITPDGKSMCVRRAKGQENVSPFVLITDGLSQTLEALRKWKAAVHPNSPWFFPSPLNPGKPVHKDSLGQALNRIRKSLPRKFTPHGMRGHFVLVRRSHGILDSQIAYEIGHTSGGKTLAHCYGGVPPHWLTGDGPQLSWLPSGAPAWSALSAGTAADSGSNTSEPACVINNDFGAKQKPIEQSGRLS